MTDIVTSILSFLCLMRGASRGFINSLLPPFSIIAATILSIIYYQVTKDVIVSLLIGLIGPFLLHQLLKIIFKSFVKGAASKMPSFLSRLGGAVLTLAWGWVFIILTLILLAVLPPLGNTLKALHNDVMKSKSYLIIKPLQDRLFAPLKQNVPATTSLASNNDAKSLSQDPRFQAILQDPEIQKAIDAHDIVKLMSNPKVLAFTQQVMNDPAAMKKILSVYNSQKQLQASPSTRGL